MADTWKEVSTTWRGGKTFIGENPAGGKVNTGSLQDSAQISPIELLLVGLAGCTGVDVVGILEKKKVALTDFKINVRGKRAKAHPRVYTEIEVEYLFWSENLKAKDAEQAIKLSEEKYCSASAMLAKTAKITSTYKILDPGQAGA
ncbi:MAG: OsmC family protein [Anaerolineales bacterium]